MSLMLFLFIFVIALNTYAVDDATQYADLDLPINQTFIRLDGKVPWTGDQDVYGYNLTDIGGLYTLSAYISDATIESVTVTNKLLLGDTEIINDGLFQIKSNLNVLNRASRYFFWDSSLLESTMVLDAFQGDLTVKGNLSSANWHGYSWDLAYDDRLKWDGGPIGLDPIAGRASLRLGSAALRNVDDIMVLSPNLPTSQAVGDYLVNHDYVRTPLTRDFDVGGNNIVNVANLTIKNDPDYEVDTTLETQYDLDVVLGAYDMDFPDECTFKVRSQPNNYNTLVVGNYDVISSFNKEHDGKFQVDVVKDGEYHGDPVFIINQENILCVTDVVMESGLKIGNPTGEVEAGSVFVSGSYLSTGSDFGEWFRIQRENTIPPGRFVALDVTLDRGVRLATPDDDYIVGVSTHGISGFYGDNASRVDLPSIPVGIVGKVTVEVEEGQNIQRGSGVIVGERGKAVSVARGVKPIGMAIANQVDDFVLIFIK